MVTSCRRGWPWARIGAPLLASMYSTRQRAVGADGPSSRAAQAFRARWREAPVTTADVPAAALDGLAHTGYLDVGSDATGHPRPLVDVSHIWVLLDAALNGWGNADLPLSVYAP